MYPELAEDEPETFEQLKAGISNLIGEPEKIEQPALEEKTEKKAPVEVMKVMDPVKPAKKQKKDLDYEF